MNPQTVCSQCLRSWRQQMRLQKPLPRHTALLQPSRSFTSTSAQNDTPRPQAPAGSPSVGEPSASQMQKEIAANLGRPHPSGFAMNIAQKLRKTARSTTETYITYGVTESLVKSCATQADYTIPEAQRAKVLTGEGPPKTAEGEDLGQPEITSWWFDVIGLEPTFSTWSQVTYLHLYLLTVRLRTFQDPKQFQDYQRYLIEHFSHDAEDKMLLLHNISARGVRNKYLKDLFIQWRGILAAYDEGLVRGDAVLGAAVWRNLFKGREDVDWDKVALVVAYIRKASNRLAAIQVDQLIHNLDTGAEVWKVSRQDLQRLVNTKSDQSVAASS